MTIEEGGYEDAGILSDIVSRANKPVAVKFGLNRDNAPSHPSFATPDWICSGMDRGERYFLAEMSCRAVGCVAYESPGPELAYLNRLAVLPGVQGKGVGKQLVDHVISLAGKDGKQTISIGIIKAHTALKNWYLSQGFEPSGSKVFDHLPFDVQFMTLHL